MPVEKVLLASVLVPKSPLRQHVRPGTGALKRTDVTLIAEPERARIGDSVDLDEATRVESPQENRWDYIVSVPDSEALIAIEPHGAKESEVSVVIAKKRHAMSYLATQLPPKHRVKRWLWVSHGKVGFSRLDRARRQLNQHGIEFVGRAVRSLG